MIQFVVLTPTYKRNRLLARTIRSVINQDLKDFVYIIIDDAHDPNCEKTVKSFADKRIVYLPRVRQETDKKTSATALNFGLEYLFNKFTGIKFLKIVHDDDLLYRGVLKRHVSLFNKNKTLAFIYGREIRIDEVSNTYEVRGCSYSANPRILKYYLLANCLQYTTFSYRTKIFKRIKNNGNFYNPRTSCGEDKDAAAKYLTQMKRLKLTAAFDAKAGSIYRRSGQDRITANLSEIQRLKDLALVNFDNTSMLKTPFVYGLNFLKRPTHLIPRPVRTRSFIGNIDEALYHQRHILTPERLKLLVEWWKKP